MVISDDIREQVIKEYEQEKYLALCERRVRSKPLGRAQQYFRLLTYRYGSITDGKSWQSEVNEAVKREICNRYGISKIRELRVEDYDEANEYAIELFTEETEIRGYKKDEVTIATMPWIKNRFTGRFTKTLRKLTWDEWKKKCYDEVH